MTIVRHLIHLQARIEGIAETASVRGQAGVSLDETLAALDEHPRPSKYLPEVREGNAKFPPKDPGAR